LSVVRSTRLMMVSGRLYPNRIGVQIVSTRTPLATLVADHPE
jgi:hypothetical protein